MGYFGGKNGAGVYQKIINIMPPHDVYIEPFLGAGAIMRHKKPALMNIGMDIDSNVMKKWESGSYTVKNSDRSGDIDKNSDAAEPGFRFIDKSAFDFLGSYKFIGNELCYLDPPYLHETRGKTRYKHDLSTKDHCVLLDLIKKLPCMVIISSYFSNLYAESLKEWNTLNFNAMTRSGKIATEWLWFNFPEPVILHDYSFLGDNFRERERIKRKKDRWVSRINEMSILEKRALLHALTLTDSMKNQTTRILSPKVTMADPASSKIATSASIPIIGDGADLMGDYEKTVNIQERNRLMAVFIVFLWALIIFGGYILCSLQIDR